MQAASRGEIERCEQLVGNRRTLGGRREDVEYVRGDGEADEPRDGGCEQCHGTVGRLLAGRQVRGAAGISEVVALGEFVGLPGPTPAQRGLGVGAGLPQLRSVLAL